MGKGKRPTKSTLSSQLLLWAPGAASQGAFRGQSVLKCEFRYYLAVARPTDQETTAIGKRACYSRFPRGGMCHIILGHMGKHQGWSGGRERGTVKSLYCDFCRKDQVRQGKVLWLTDLNIFSGLWGIRLSLVLPKVIRAQGEWPGVSEPNKSGV